MKKFLFLLLALGLLASGAFAQVTISGGVALGSAEYSSSVGSGYTEKGDIGIGGNIYLDYILPIGVPLSLGAEFGVDTSKFTHDYSGGSTWEDTATVFPLLLRVAYHFDFHPKLDLYLVGKIGYVFADFKGDTVDNLPSGYSLKAEGGIGYAFDIGIAYYFTQLVGIFAEAGFDEYNGKISVTGTGYSENVNAKFNRFVTAGLSIKL